MRRSRRRFQAGALFSIVLALTGAGILVSALGGRSERHGTLHEGSRGATGQASGGGEASGRGDARGSGSRPDAAQAPQKVGLTGGSRAAGVAGPNLARGSDPGVLPGPVLIADRNNNRLIEVSPEGRIIWRFPPAQGLARGESFVEPDDAFFSPTGGEIVATQEDDFAISVIAVARDRLVYRYGHPGVPGSAPGYLDNPDDAMMMSNRTILAADIKNCRLIVLRPPSHRLVRQLGSTGRCIHEPVSSFGSPNGAFPVSGGGTAVTEINGDWLDVLTADGRLAWATHPPGFTYPSDTNEARQGVFLSADYTSPGAIETFTPSGRLLWRYEPRGAKALNHPSLALPLPNGDVLANDDANDRVIVIDPKTNEIVWQYGHTGRPGRRPGYLSNPDGVDLAPPYSLTMRFAKTLNAP